MAEGEKSFFYYCVVYPLPVTGGLFQHAGLITIAGGGDWEASIEKQ